MANINSMLLYQQNLNRSRLGLGNLYPQVETKRTYIQNPVYNHHDNFENVNLETDKTAVYNRVLEQLKQEEDEPSDWVPTLYSTLHEFEADIPKIIESLMDDSGKTLYDTKGAKQNLRDLIKNAGTLYNNYYESKK